MVAAGRDLEHAAHEPHRKGAGMLLDEPKPHLGISAKMPIAFLRHRAPCACNRVHAAAVRSRPPDRLETPLQQNWSAQPSSQLSTAGWPPCTTLRQLRSIEGEIPSSVAICIRGRPLLSSRATASRLNSGVNSRLVLVIKHLPAPAGA